MTTFTGVISYPIPPYSNPPIHPEFYDPSRFVISTVALGQTTTVTTILDHDYVIGQLVKLLIPSAFGCFQLNNAKGYVLSIPSTTQVEIAIDSSVNVNQYIAATSTQVPQIIALGDINMGAINATGRINTGTFIPGSFIDISP